MNPKAVLKLLTVDLLPFIAYSIGYGLGKITRNFSRGYRKMDPLDFD